MKKSIRILDKGYLRLVDSMGDDLSIARNARVSYDATWRVGTDKGSDERLINYMMKNSHNTPFEAVVAAFEVKAPLFVLRQWHRHRTQSYNEISARYCNVTPEFYVPDVNNITKQCPTNKQARTNEVHEYAQEMAQMIQDQQMQAFVAYNTLINKGCPRELARIVLPVGTYTVMFAQANLHNWFRFLAERLDARSQYEIRVYAQAILVALQKIAPVACAAFIDKIGYQ